MFIETLFLLSAANAGCENCSVSTVTATPIVVNPVLPSTVFLAPVAPVVATGAVEIEYKRNIFGKLVPVRAVQKLPKAKSVKTSGSSCKSCNK